MLNFYLQLLDTEESRSRFEQLYLLYRDLMFSVAVRLLHNEADAEDAVHQSFLAILRHFSKISEIDCPKTKAYVVIITESKTIDLLRERKRLVDISPEAIETAPLPMPGDGGLADALARLPRRYRDALLLRYRHGYKTPELAALWNMKLSSAQKLLWRAKTALRKELEKESDE